jgi:hypothetical protein
MPPTELLKDGNVDKAAAADEGAKKIDALVFLFLCSKTKTPSPNTPFFFLLFLPTIYDASRTGTT